MTESHISETSVPTSDSDVNEIQVVEFMVGEETFAINLFDVREIVEASKITPLPHAASHVRGIIDLRGEITNIIDLRTILHIAKGSGDALTDARFIVLDERVTKGKTGIVVDEVTSVLTVPTSDIDRSSHSDDEESYILGIIKKSTGDHGEGRKELVIWIDIRTLLQNMS